jgi:hypothetical protein
MAFVHEVSDVSRRDGQLAADDDARTCIVEAL